MRSQRRIAINDRVSIPAEGGGIHMLTLQMLPAAGYDAGRRENTDEIPPVELALMRELCAEEPEGLPGEEWGFDDQAVMQ